MSDTLAFLRQKQENGGFNELLGMRIRTIRPGYAEVELPADERVLNALGNAHGGAIYALCDTAAGTAAASYGRLGVTLNASHRESASGEKRAVPVRKDTGNQGGKNSSGLWRYREQMKMTQRLHRQPLPRSTLENARNRFHDEGDGSRAACMV